MESKIRQLIDEIPERPTSRTAPHLDVIRELRRKRQSYREIAEFLEKHLQVKVSITTIRDSLLYPRGRRREKAD